MDDAKVYHQLEHSPFDHSSVVFECLEAELRETLP
jgi:hypothetical protein